MVAAAPVLSPEPATLRRRLNFWSGRSLDAEAFETEQRHRSGHLAACGLALSTGVVRGLGVGLRRGASATSPDLTGLEILVSPGIGLASSGEEVVVSRPIRVRVTDLPWITFATQTDGSIVPVDWSAKVKAYQLWNTSVAWSAMKNLSLTVGVKNLLDKDPPFSAAYDGNTGAGSSWEPRVADPRGRSYTLQLDYKFF